LIQLNQHCVEFSRQSIACFFYVEKSFLGRFSYSFCLNDWMMWNACSAPNELIVCSDALLLLPGAWNSVLLQVGSSMSGF